ncbi:MAG: NAD(P)H-hydrate dehydratase [Proteobacteria bacterium]|nr:NAD(P)H-hydrate dehydratase [Pseudomonadota bacterium]
MQDTSFGWTAAAVLHLRAPNGTLAGARMIGLWTRDEVRALDRDAVDRLGVPSLALMENAGLGATLALLEHFSRSLARIVIVGGTGQNGGDAWVVARQLRVRGHRPRCVLLGEASTVRGDARVNLDALANLGIPLTEVGSGSGLSALGDALADATLVVEGLFGTGLDRPVTGHFAEAIERINSCRAARMALDLPSGVDADTGRVLGRAVRAQLTTTFAAHKRGLHQYPGAELAGKIVRIPIGVPASDEVLARIVEPADVGAWLARREPDVHKGSAGHVLVVAGSPGRTGAAMLAGMGALRSGAGLVTLACRPAARRSLDGKVVELMTIELSDSLEVAVPVALREASDKSAVVVGPGLGLEKEARSLVFALAEQAPVPTVLDADALTLLSGELPVLKRAPAPRVLTPHPGEAARLLGVTSGQIQADRYAAAVRIATESGAVVILKGAGTVVADPGGRLRVCRRGTPALATAGSGDVLSGVVATLLAGLPALEAASAAAVLHARAAELAAVSDRGMLAREVAQALPRALEKVRGPADPARLC